MGPGTNPYAVGGVDRAVDQVKRLNTWLAAHDGHAYRVSGPWLQIVRPDGSLLAQAAYLRDLLDALDLLPN